MVELKTGTSLGAEGVLIKVEGSDVVECEIGGRLGIGDVVAFMIGGSLGINHIRLLVRGEGRRVDRKFVKDRLGEDGPAEGGPDKEVLGKLNREEDGWGKAGPGVETDGTEKPLGGASERNVLD